MAMNGYIYHMQGFFHRKYIAPAVKTIALGVSFLSPALSQILVWDITSGNEKQGGNVLLGFSKSSESLYL